MPIRYRATSSLWQSFENSKNRQLGRICPNLALTTGRSSQPVAATRCYSASPADEQPKDGPSYTFETGFSLFQKRPSRPFPPPFISPPTSSFSEPLSTHHYSRLRRQEADTTISDLLRGHTNGDDAILARPRYLGVADGVGAWNTKPHGNAALWSRLILHYFSIAADKYFSKPGSEPDVVKFLQEAYVATVRATAEKGLLGTTTACCCILVPPKRLLVVNVGDSQCRVLRPRKHEFVLKTEEQWHWFDCPRQLGTNSPDTPEVNGVVTSIELEDDDIVILSSDGMPDNLWEHEVITLCLKTLGLAVPDAVDANDAVDELTTKAGVSDNVIVALKTTEVPDDMTRVAAELVKASKAVATDPYAESPWMERAIDEGLAVEGGKFDDISVVVARLSRQKPPS